MSSTHYVAVISDRFFPDPIDVSPGDSISFTLAEPGPLTVSFQPRLGQPHLELFSSFTLQRQGDSVTLTVASSDPGKETDYKISALLRGDGHTGMTGTIRVGGGSDKPPR